MLGMTIMSLLINVGLLIGGVVGAKKFLSLVKDKNAAVVMAAAVGKDKEAVEKELAEVRAKVEVLTNSRVAANKAEQDVRSRNNALLKACVLWMKLGSFYQGRYKQLADAVDKLLDRGVISEIILHTKEGKEVKYGGVTWHQLGLCRRMYGAQFLNLEGDRYEKISQELQDEATALKNTRGRERVEDTEEVEEVSVVKRLKNKFEGAAASVGAATK